MNDFAMIIIVERKIRWCLVWCPFQHLHVEAQSFDALVALATKVTFWCNNWVANSFSFDSKESRLGVVVVLFRLEKLGQKNVNPSFDCISFD
jgi:hypothetical protein